jgi:succinate dehydrogenase/fumarate reductase cytochrome b subunit
MIAAMVSEPERRLGVLRRRTAATLVVLVVQFVVGMSLNLYVTIPSHHPGAGSGPYLSGVVSSVLWSLTSGLPLLIVHVLIGIVLLLSGIELVVHSVRARRRAASWLAAVGLTAIIFAGFNGASFLKYTSTSARC